MRVFRRCVNRLFGQPWKGVPGPAAPRSDATVFFTMSPELTGGSKRTAEFAVKHRKPCLRLPAGETVEHCARRLAEFIQESGIRILNGAGSRGWKEPEVGAFVSAVLDAAS